MIHIVMPLVITNNIIKQMYHMYLQYSFDMHDSKNNYNVHITNENN